LSFRMNVREDKVLKDGAYPAQVLNVEKKETRFGERLMWPFEVPSENTEVVGFTSMSPSTKARAYEWAAAITGEIDPTIGWGPEDVIGGGCTVVLEEAEDAQGVKKNKVVKVKPTRKKPEAAGNPSEPGDPGADSDRIPF
jgi:hypothetical protein